jgi:hypothetical protein
MSYRTNMRDLKNAVRQFERRQTMYKESCEPNEANGGIKKEEHCCNTCRYGDTSGRFLLCTCGPIHVEVSTHPESDRIIKKSPEDHCCGQWRHK